MYNTKDSFLKLCDEPLFFVWSKTLFMKAEPKVETESEEHSGLM